jgi:hypothetical protein
VTAVKRLRIVIRVLALIVVGVVIALVAIVAVAIIFGGGLGDHS